MKRLLILAYDFPPYVSVGALRPYAWYKYLKEYGIYPIVVTRQWGNAYGDERDYIAPGESKETIIEETEYGTIIRTPYKPNMANRLMLKYGKKRFALLRKAISAFYELSQYIWNIGPKSCVYRGAKQYLKTHTVDAIIATGEPFVLFKYASVLSHKYNIPWIADYRDPWTQGINSRNNVLLGIRNRYFEQKYVTHASAVTTVSTFCKCKISTLINKVPFYIISNGYNEENIQCIESIKQNNTIFSIAFAGSVYAWHPIANVLKTIENWKKKNNVQNISIHFYGVSNYAGVDILACAPTLGKHIYFHPKCDNHTMMQELSLHNVMLLMNDYSIMGTKIYDYIAVRRKIILCYANDEASLKLKEQYFPINEIDGINTHLQTDLIETTHSGIVVQNSTHLMQVLYELYQEFSSNGYIACESVNVEKYSRKEQTKILANIIKNI